MNGTICQEAFIFAGCAVQHAGKSMAHAPKERRQCVTWQECVAKVLQKCCKRQQPSTGAQCAQEETRT